MAVEIGGLGGPDGSAPSTRKAQYMEEIGQTREKPVWERDDAPPGSTAESLLVFENGRPVRVAGPTHYVHLADGRVIGGYGGGTLHADVDDDGNQRVTRVVANHEG